MLIFNKKYFLFAVILFIAEVLIALYVRDAFVRPYVGDYLVVMLIYCAVKAFFNTPVCQTAIGVLLFSYLIETLQYFHIVDRLGLQDNVVARTVIGYGFEWKDLVAYTLGVLTIILLEKKNPAQQQHRPEKKRPQ